MLLLLLFCLCISMNLSSILLIKIYCRLYIIDYFINCLRLYMIDYGLYYNIIVMTD